MHLLVLLMCLRLRLRGRLALIGRMQPMMVEVQCSTIKYRTSSNQEASSLSTREISLHCRLLSWDLNQALFTHSEFNHAIWLATVTTQKLLIFWQLKFLISQKAWLMCHRLHLHTESVSYGLHPSSMVVRQSTTTEFGSMMQEETAFSKNLKPSCN